MNALEQNLGRHGECVQHIIIMKCTFAGQLIVASCTTKLSAHIENKFLLKKLPGTIEWLQRKRPSVVVYCPIWNRIAQISSLVLGIPHGKVDLHCVNPTCVYSHLMNSNILLASL